MQKLAIISMFIFSLILGLSFNLKAIESIDFSNQDEEILILDLSANGFKTGNNVISYVYNETMYFSVLELSNYLKFNIKSYNLFSLHGWYQSTENVVNIELDKNVITSSYKTVRFSKDDVAVHDGVLYFSKPLIERIFHLRLVINEKALSVDAVSKQDFFIQAEYKKQLSRNDVQVSRTDDEIKERFNMSDSLFSIPSADFYATSARHKDGSSNNYLNLNMAGVVGGFDSNVSIAKNYQRYVEEGKPVLKEHDTDVSIRFSKTAMEDEHKMLGFSYFTAGDIYSTSSNLLTKSENGRGVYVSTNTDYEINEDQTVTIEGAIQSGWEIELYQNDQLLAFTTDTLEGRYIFENVPVNYGVNVFKIVFYGPFGERREEERKYIIGNMPASKGKVSARLSYIETNKNVIEAGNSVDENGKSVKIPLVSLSYGLTDFSAISTTYTQQKNLQSGALENLVNMGFSINRDAMGMEYYMGHNLALADRTAHNIILSGATDIGNIFANYESYNGIRSNRSYVFDDVYISSNAELRYNYFLNMNGLHVPAVLNFKRINYENDNSYAVDFEDRLTASLSHTLFGRQYITLENTFNVIQNLDETSDTYNDVSLILSSNFGGSSLKVQSQYNTKPYKELSLISAKIDRRFLANRLYSYIDYSRTFYYLNNSKLDKLEVGVSTSTDNHGSLRLASGGYSTGDRYVMLSYGITLGYNSASNRVFTTAYDTSSSVISALVYVDNDGNNEYDENIDERVKNAKITTSANMEGDVSDEKGVSTVYGVQPFEKTKVMLDDSEIADIYLSPSVEQHNIITRPGVVSQVQFALQKTGDIEGNIAINNEKAQFLNVNVYDKNNQIVATSTTDAEGNFLVERLAYGTYSLKVADSDNSVSEKGKELVLSNHVLYVNLDVQKDESANLEQANFSSNLVASKEFNIEEDEFTTLEQIGQKELEKNSLSSTDLSIKVVKAYSY